MKKKLNFYKLLIGLCLALHPSAPPAYFQGAIGKLCLAPASSLKHLAAEKVILAFIKESSMNRGAAFIEALIVKMKEERIYSSEEGLNESFLSQARSFLKKDGLIKEEREKARELFLSLPYSEKTKIEFMRTLGIPLVFKMYEKEQEIERRWAENLRSQNRWLNQFLIEEAGKLLTIPGHKAELNGVGAFVRLYPRANKASKFVAHDDCSHPYLTESAYEVLKFIAALWVKRCQAVDISTEKSQLLVNSASRTPEGQEGLLKEVDTAAPTSTHLTGYTFDLWAKWFKYNDYRQAQILMQIFAALQEAGAINLLDEGHVWHVAVNPLIEENQLLRILEQVAKKLSGEQTIELNEDGSLDVYCDFEETITLPYSQQKTSMPQIVAESISDLEERKRYLAAFNQARENYLRNPTEEVYRAYFRAFGKGLLHKRHCEILAKSWSLNPKFIEAIRKLKTASGATRLNVTIVGRGFTQPFRIFINQNSDLLSELGVTVVGYKTNTLIFDGNGFFTGEIESPVIIDKAKYVPHGKIFIGDDRDAEYSFSHFINVHDDSSIGNIPTLFRISRQTETSDTERIFELAI